MASEMSYMNGLYKVVVEPGTIFNWHAHIFYFDDEVKTAYADRVWGLRYEIWKEIRKHQKVMRIIRRRGGPL